MTSTNYTVSEFIKAACVPRDDWHASGTLDRANEILAAHPEIANRNINTAAILGDDIAVREFLARDAASATAKSGPYDWDALTYLCFSRYLRLDRARSDGFVRAATALLDAGANPNTGWFENDHQPKPEWESAIYGAAGLAHHAELTRLLLERGAHPNDAETAYHAPETYDNDAMKVLVQSGKLNANSLTTLLLRKTDWHDYEGLKWLLESGVDPNGKSRWGSRTTILHAALRDNNIKIFEALLDHGADPLLTAEGADPFQPTIGGKSAVAIAARRGRGDVLELFQRRGISIDLYGADRLMAACARNDSLAIRLIVSSEPQIVREVIAEGGTLLAQFAGNGNNDGIRQLLDLGVKVDAASTDGDAYFDVTKNSTALHSAAWRARHTTVKLLLARGAAVDALDAKGRTPLALAVRACVDSYWTDRRSPESVQMLLDAGASVSGVAYPSGYAEVDALLAQKKH